MNMGGKARDAILVDIGRETYERLGEEKIVQIRYGDERLVVIQVFDDHELPDSGDGTEPEDNVRVGIQ